MSFRFQPWLGCRELCRAVRGWKVRCAPRRGRSDPHRERPEPSPGVRTQDCGPGSSGGSSRCGSSTVERARGSPHPGRGTRSAPVRGRGAGVVHLSTAPSSLFLFSSKRRNVRSSSKACELWGQPSFGLVERPAPVWMTTGSNRGLRQPGGGQLLASSSCSTTIPSCPHPHPQSDPRLYPSPGGSRVLHRSGCGQSCGNSVGNRSEPCGQDVHSLWMEWGKGLVNPGDRISVDSRPFRTLFCHRGEVKPTGPRRKLLPVNVPGPTHRDRTNTESGELAAQPLRPGVRRPPPNPVSFCRPPPAAPHRPSRNPADPLPRVKTCGIRPDKTCGIRPPEPPGGVPGRGGAGSGRRNFTAGAGGRERAALSESASARGPGNHTGGPEKCRQRPNERLTF
ncbi:hypothetical protein SAMN05660874_03717 [Saccharopolyspora flava]|uniref:Uncharacterized protein n=1 Tax=Saccharopolyspora flava TaxID=95161 RepID=A0A1I6T740_9PSEU|nr:hypothetical protein SAMN05660874_03717 [Saccharopolyspora flava]